MQNQEEKEASLTPAEAYVSVECMFTSFVCAFLGKMFFFCVFFYVFPLSVPDSFFTQSFLHIFILRGRFCKDYGRPNKIEFNKKKCQIDFENTFLSLTYCYPSSLLLQKGSQALQVAHHLEKQTRIVIISILKFN